MKTTVIIEKASDGTFAAYADKSIDNFLPAGYGDTVEAALEDFGVSIEEMNEIREEEGKKPLSPVFEYRYDIESFFNYFPYLNVSQVGKKAGINPSLMRQYAKGLTKAGQKQYDKIRNTIRAMATELSATTL